MTMKENIKTRLEFDVTTDENTVPLSITWKSSDSGSGRIKALMAGMWDEKEANTFRIDLWTKDMTVEEMQHFFVQSLLTMSDTFERATGDRKGADDLRTFSREFGLKIGVLREK